MSGSLFISYSRSDMTPNNWIERVRTYLGPVGRNAGIEIWDDSKIGVGSEWRTEIQQELERATAAVLLVGPGFLNSDFVMNEELPVLLRKARRG